jgi:hypothetical protein
MAVVAASASVVLPNFWKAFSDTLRERGGE